MEHIWKTGYLGDTRTLDVHVRWLREKIELDPDRPEHVVTDRGVGWSWSRRWLKHCRKIRPTGKSSTRWPNSANGLSHRTCGWVQVLRGGRRPDEAIPSLSLRLLRGCGPRNDKLR